MTLLLYERLSKVQFSTKSALLTTVTAAPVPLSADTSSGSATTLGASVDSDTHINENAVRESVGDVHGNLDDNVDHQQQQQQPQGDEQASPHANVAFFIQIADNTIHHFPRLLRALHHPQNVYAIHFDLKIPDDAVKSAVTHIESDERYAKNVHIMQSELITYRGVSMLLNTINAMRLLLDIHPHWDYFTNLSGADYPLISPTTVRRLLGVQKGLNFFTFAPRRTWNSMAENRLSEVWYDESLTFRRSASLGKLTKLVVRNPLVDDLQFEVSHAEAWMVASREFSDFVVRGDMARKMLVALAYAADSSEHYFASLAWNNEQFKKTIVPHSLRMIIWMHKGVLAGQHPYFVDEQNEKGEYEFMEDMNSSVLFFARKFEKADSKLMDIIDKRAEEREVIEKVEEHVIAKISSRALRISEL